MQTMDSAKVETELAKMLADETARLTAETVKLNREPLLYPIIVSAFCIGALLAILKFLL